MERRLAKSGGRLRDGKWSWRWITLEEERSRIVAEHGLPLPEIGRRRIWDHLMVARRCLPHERIVSRMTRRDEPEGRPSMRVSTTRRARWRSYGTLRLADGEVYEGQWKGSKMAGYGTCRDADGDSGRGRGQGG